MKNLVILYKNEDGAIYCHQISEQGAKQYKKGDGDSDSWDEGGTILLSELEEILDKEV